MGYTRSANLSAGQKAVWLLGIVLLFAALTCLMIGNDNLRRANRTKPTIHTLTAAELIANGPGDNAYVRIEHATALLSWYAVYRDRYGNANWQTIYIPLAPANASPADTAGPHLILRTTAVWSKTDLPKLNEAGSFEGIAYKGVGSLTQSAQNLLKRRFPNADLANCYVIRHNARPPSKAAAIVTLVLGGLALLGVLMLGFGTRTLMMARRR